MHVIPVFVLGAACEFKIKLQSKRGTCCIVKFVYDKSFVVHFQVQAQSETNAKSK